MRPFNQQSPKPIVAKCYCLIDSKGVVFYVGITVNNLKTRMLAHLTNARNYEYNKAKFRRKMNLNKINRIKESNYDISIQLLEKKEVRSMDEKFALEAKWIIHCIVRGIELTNTQKEKMLSLETYKIPA